VMIVDYVSFRITQVHDDDYLLLRKLLGLENEHLQSRSGRFYVRYDSLYTFNGILNIYFSSEYQELFVEISAEGLEYVYSYNSSPDRSIYNKEYNLIYNLFWAFQDRIFFTRFDVAIDVFDKSLAEPVLSALRNFEYLSQSKKRIHIVQHSAGSYSGETYYLGSNQSERRMRIYDKAQEQGLDIFWYRFELQTRKDWANLVAFYWKEGNHQAIASIFDNMFSPRRPSQDGNKSRWDRLQEWLKILSLGNKLKISLKKKTKTLLNFVSYVRDVLARRLRQAFEFDKKLIDDILSIELDFRRKREVELLYSYLASVPSGEEGFLDEVVDF